MNHKNMVTAAQVSEEMKNYTAETVYIGSGEHRKRATLVSLTMSNGFVLTEISTCVDDANYALDMGTMVGLERLEDKVWHLLGYALQDKLHKEKQTNEK